MSTRSMSTILIMLCIVLISSVVCDYENETKSNLERPSKKRRTSEVCMNIKIFFYIIIKTNNRWTQLCLSNSGLWTPPFQYSYKEEYLPKKYVSGIRNALFFIFCHFKWSNFWIGIYEIKSLKNKIFITIDQW